MPSWTRQLKAANEEYAALNAKYLETDGAKQFLAEQQEPIAAAAECEVASSEAEDEGEEEQSATIKRKRRAPKQKKDPNGAVGALAHLPNPTFDQFTRQQLSTILSEAADSPSKLSRLSRVCCGWRSLICGQSRETEWLWEQTKLTWWTPLGSGRGAP